jgi:hypothetical protein
VNKSWINVVGVVVFLQSCQSYFEESQRQQYIPSVNLEFISEREEPLVKVYDRCVLPLTREQPDEEWRGLRV